MDSGQIRKFYEKETGERIPDNFHIHHIDMDRNNNDILNLVALPLSLHNRYHAIQRRLNNLIPKFKTSNYPCSKDVECLGHILDMMNHFLAIKHNQIVLKEIFDSQIDVNESEECIGGEK